MDFFKQIQAPTLHEAEVIVPIDNRGGGNKGLPRSEELKRKLSDFYKGKSLIERLGKEKAQQTVEKTLATKKANGRIRMHKGKTLKEWAVIHNCNVNTIHVWVAQYGLSTVENYKLCLRPKNFKWQGLTVKQWAVKLGVSESWVRYCLKRDGHLDKLIAKKG